MKRTVALVGLVLLSGCSLLGTRPIPVDLPPVPYPQCTEALFPTAVDMTLGLIGTVIVGGLVRYHESGKSILAVGAPAAVLLGSGIYGEVMRQRCQAAREKADRSISRPY
jgi:hypothetical protein